VPAQKGCGDRAVPVRVPVPLQKPQGHHRIGKYPECATGDAYASCHVVQGRWSVRQGLKKPNFVRHKEVFRRHETIRDLKDQIRRDLRHRLSPVRKSSSS
jgi:hypothetical protein